MLLFYQVGQYATSFLLWVSVLGVLLLCGFLFIECVAALFPVVADPVAQKEISQPLINQTVNGEKGETRVTVMVPAHNEENAIAHTLEQLNLQLNSTAAHHQEVVVVADNCNDRTAEVAKTYGAKVIERFDQSHQGKGYALDYGIQYLSANPPDVLVIVDADCQVEHQTIPLLTQTVLATGKPAQANYLMQKPDPSTPKDGISAFAFKVKNLVRSRGLAKLGLPCVLAGTGMAFPWQVIRKINLASGHIVEDMKLGLDLNLAGYGAVFCPDAMVCGTLPHSHNTATTQRTRWEHGHLQTLFTYAPILVGGALRQRRWDLLWIALDLCIPPLSLLVMLWLGVSLISWVAGIFTMFWLPAILMVVSGLLLFSAILIAWSRFAASELPLTQLLSIPLYILWKIPLYLRFLIKRERNWIRTDRN